MATFGKNDRWRMHPTATQAGMDLREKRWAELEEGYQAEFARDVDKMAKDGKGLQWLCKGTGTFGTGVRPVPSQPWRPLRMRFVGTGTMVPEQSIEVADRTRLGRTMPVAPQTHAVEALDKPPSGPKAEKALRVMVKEQRRRRKHAEQRLQALESKLTRIRTGSQVLDSPLSSPSARSSPSVRSGYGGSVRDSARSGYDGREDDVWSPSTPSVLSPAPSARSAAYVATPASGVHRSETLMSSSRSGLFSPLSTGSGRFSRR